VADWWASVPLFRLALTLKRGGVRSPLSWVSLPIHKSPIPGPVSNLALNPPLTHAFDQSTSPITRLFQRLFGA